MNRLLANDPDFTEFSFSRQRFPDLSDFKKFSTALAKNTHLIRLVINECNLIDEHIEILSDGLCSNTSLIVLYLNYNLIGDRGAHYLARAIRANTTLKFLSLTGNIIRIDGAEALLDAVQYNLTLQDINLGINRIESCWFFTKLIYIMREIREINHVINEQTPPLGDGWSDAGDFDALPNEILSQIAMLVWPTSKAIELAHACRRWRDVVMSDFVIMDRRATTRRVTQRNMFIARKME